MSYTVHSGADCLNPASYTAIRANGAGACRGGPEDARVEAERDAWFAAPDDAAEEVGTNRLNRAALDAVVFAPNRFFLSCRVWRAHPE